MDQVRELSLVDSSSRKRQWRVTVLADRLRLAPEDAPENHELLRTEAGTRLLLHSSFPMGKTLVAKVPKPVIFKLDEAAFAVLRDWVGPLTAADLKLQLRQSLRWTIPIGILFILGSLPLSGDPESGIQAVPFDPVSFGLGLGLIALSVLARVWRHRLLFALDGVWFLLLAADTAWDVVGRGRSPWWLLIVAFLLLAALQPLSAYRRFVEAGVVKG